MDIESQLMTLLLKGYCCSEAILQFGLTLRGEENPQLVGAAGGLCLGLCSGHVCGALSAGALLLSLFDKSTARTVMIPDLVAWFSDAYGEAYGSINCADIAGENLRYKPERCFCVMSDVCKKCVSLLHEAGLLD